MDLEKYLEEKRISINFIKIYNTNNGKIITNDLTTHITSPSPLD